MKGKPWELLRQCLKPRPEGLPRLSYQAQYIRRPCSSSMLLSPPETNLSANTFRNSSSYRLCPCRVLDPDVDDKMASRTKGFEAASCLTDVSWGRGMRGKYLIMERYCSRSDSADARLNRGLTPTSCREWDSVDEDLGDMALRVDAGDETKLPSSPGNNLPITALWVSRSALNLLSTSGGGGRSKSMLNVLDRPEGTAGALASFSCGLLGNGEREVGESGQVVSARSTKGGYLPSAIAWPVRPRDASRYALSLVLQTSGRAGTLETAGSDRLRLGWKASERALPYLLQTPGWSLVSQRTLVARQASHALAVRLRVAVCSSVTAAVAPVTGHAVVMLVVLVPAQLSVLVGYWCEGEGECKGECGGGVRVRMRAQRGVSVRRDGHTECWPRASRHHVSKARHTVCLHRALLTSQYEHGLWAPRAKHLFKLFAQ